MGSLHWPAGGLNLGVGGVSYVELLILYELWAGERPSLEKAHPRYLGPGRPISVVGFVGLCLAPLVASTSLRKLRSSILKVNGLVVSLWLVLVRFSA